MAERRGKEEGSEEVLFPNRRPQNAAASLGDQWSINGGVMGIKRGVSAEIIADSPDSPSKSCKHSRELREKKMTSDRRQRRTTCCCLWVTDAVD